MHLKVLDKNQLLFLEELKKLDPFLKRNSFLLIGGTSLSLQIGHRVSIDFDFMCSRRMSEDKILLEIEKCLDEVRVIRKDERTLDLDWKGVKISFFSGVTHPLLKKTLDFRHLELLSVEDIAAMKIATIMHRNEAKDYFDIATLLHFHQFKLSDILKWFQKKYGKQSKTFPVSLILKTLSYTDDLSTSGLKYLNHEKFWKEKSVKGGIQWIMDRHVQEFLKKKID